MGIMNNTGGKGSATRPLSVDTKTFGDNFDRIFGRKDDPVKHCEIYKTQGCAHVDGPICDFKTCKERLEGAK